MCHPWNILRRNTNPFTHQANTVFTIKLDSANVQPKSIHQINIHQPTCNMYKANTQIIVDAIDEIQAIQFNENHTTAIATPSTICNTRIRLERKQTIGIGQTSSLLRNNRKQIPSTLQNHRTSSFREVQSWTPSQPPQPRPQIKQRFSTKLYVTAPINILLHKHAQKLPLKKLNSMNTALDCVHCIQQLEHSPTLMRYSKHHICKTHSTTLDTRQTTHTWKQQAVIICVYHRRQLFPSVSETQIQHNRQLIWKSSRQDS